MSIRLPKQAGTFSGAKSPALVQWVVFYRVAISAMATDLVAAGTCLFNYGPLRDRTLLLYYIPPLALSGRNSSYDHRPRGGFNLPL